ncbi:MAG TPA: hypothetical protein VFH54_19305 [Mycobacteriales bacterium]|nr:hypothetical protein [Mycobacteriales bacterium]
MGLSHSLRRLDDAVLPGSWLKSDPLRAALVYLYGVSVLAVVGIVVELVWDYPLLLILAGVNVVFGTLHLSTALRDRSE